MFVYSFCNLFLLSCLFIYIISCYWFFSALCLPRFPVHLVSFLFCHGIQLANVFLVCLADFPVCIVLCGLGE